MLVGSGLDDGIHQNPRHPHAPGVERAGCGDALDLADHDAAGVPGGKRHGKRFQPKRLTLHGDVAIGVGRRAADQSDVDGEAPEKQIVLASDP